MYVSLFLWLMQGGQMVDIDIRDIEGQRRALMLIKRYGVPINKHVLTEEDILLYQQVEKYVAKLAMRQTQKIKTRRGKYCGKKVACFGSV